MTLNVTRSPSNAVMRLFERSRKPLDGLIIGSLSAISFTAAATLARMAPQFATGVTVVTALDRDRPVGITVNALTSVSLDPAIVVIALDRRRYIIPAIDACHRYAVNILAEDQQWLSDCFAGASVTPGRDRFCGAAWRPGSTGLPLLEGAIAAMECEVTERFEVGDHFLYVGRVEELALEEPGASTFTMGAHHSAYMWCWQCGDLTTTASNCAGF